MEVLLNWRSFHKKQVIDLMKSKPSEMLEGWSVSFLLKSFSQESKHTHTHKNPSPKLISPYQWEAIGMNGVAVYKEHTHFKIYAEQQMSRRKSAIF